MAHMALVRDRGLFECSAASSRASLDCTWLETVIICICPELSGAPRDWDGIGCTCVRDVLFQCSSFIDGAVRRHGWREY